MREDLSNDTILWNIIIVDPITLTVCITHLGPSTNTVTANYNLPEPVFQKEGRNYVPPYIITVVMTSPFIQNGLHDSDPDIPDH